MNQRTLAAAAAPRPVLRSSTATTSTQRPIRIAVIDDDRLLTDALRGWIGGRTDLHLVASAPTVAAFTLAPEMVDVVLLDVLLQDGTDPAANVSRLIEQGHRVLVVTVVRDSGTAIATHAAGAHGYLTKDAGLEELARAVGEISSGGSYYSRELAHALLTDRRPSRPQLSDQEEAALRLYSSGLTLKATAQQMGVAPSTAKGYLDRVRVKYREAGRPAPTKVDLANRAREDGR